MAIDMNRTTIALPGSLGLPHEDAGDYLIIGPASAGDRKAIAARPPLWRWTAWSIPRPNRNPRK